MNLHIQDSAGVWSSPRSFLFLHVPSVASATAIYKYWFDDNTADAQNGTLTNGTLMLNASSLPVGMHTLTLQCMVGTDIRVEQHLFYKMPAPTQCTSFTFHYRIDGGVFQTIDFNSQGGAVSMSGSIRAAAKQPKWYLCAVTFLSPLCFGIYLMHPVFLNLFYKFLKISIMDFRFYVGVPLFFLIAFLGATLATWILRKISVLRKYVL